MKIGILTFHWATNYGAILQAYCLQEYLTSKGHDVSIVNYKPNQYDYNWRQLLSHPSLWKSLRKEISKLKKERMLDSFRQKYLITTQRCFNTKEVEVSIKDYDVLISGSDQVLNPSFTTVGENGKPSPVYWLAIGHEQLKRLGYAVSFGCEKYPENATTIVKPWINGFNAIGLRENTGLNVMEQLGYQGAKTVLPDPTLLIGKRLFEQLGIEIPVKRESYTCVYMLRREIEILGDVRYIDEKHHPLTMEQWLKMILHANQFVTNSYHGMIMAMFAHVPFTVLLETGSGSGMNDRFYTLLKQVGLDNRMATTTDEALEILGQPIDFGKLDAAIEDYRNVGTAFLDKYVN